MEKRCITYLYAQIAIEENNAKGDLVERSEQRSTPWLSSRIIPADIVPHCLSTGVASRIAKTFIFRQPGRKTGLRAPKNSLASACTPTGAHAQSVGCERGAGTTDALALDVS